MSGFLQHVAAGASKGRARVHPLVGSIFAERAERGGDLSGLVVPAPEWMETVSTRVDHVDEQIGHRSRREPSSRRRAEEATEPFVPVMPVDPAESTVAARSNVARESPETQQSAAPSPRVSREIMRGEAPSAESWADAPLNGLSRAVRAEAVASAPVSGHHGPQPVRSHEREFSKIDAQPEPAPRAISKAREGGDVQIHIGRVEVVAVPPSPQHPAAAPARKSMSLDEYLRQRGARVG